MFEQYEWRTYNWTTDFYAFTGNFAHNAYDMNKIFQLYYF